MKKILVLLLALMIAFTLAACGDTTPPAGDDDNVQTPEGDETPETPDEPNNPNAPCVHEGGTASCVACAVCDLCGSFYGDIDPDAHKSAESWTTDGGKHYHACDNGCDAHLDEQMCDIDVDCTGTGKCSVCGVEGTSINPDNHKLASEWTNEDGKHFYVCENGCGMIFNEGTCDITPTCTSVGKCSVCGLEGDAIDPDAHKANKSWTVTDGRHYKVCENGCGTKLYEGECDTVATCTSAGKCSVCATPGTAIDPTNHNFTKDYQMTTDKHYKTCKNGCGTVQNEAEHDFTDWQSISASTTSTKGVMKRSCTVCGYEQTKVSDAIIMPVKGGASGIVVLIHDDGTWNTVNIADQLYYDYGVVGDVAMQLNGGRVVDSGDRYDLTDDVIQTNSILKWRTLFATNRWKLISHSMTHNWWGTYTINKDSSGNTVSCTDLVPSTDLMEYEIVKSQQLLRTYFPDQRVLTFAHPGFATPKNYLPGVTSALGKYTAVFDEEARSYIDKYYIAGRGGLGILVDVNDPEGQWNTSSSTAPYAALNYSDVWNYFPAYSLDDGNLDKSLKVITSAAESGGMAVFYIHKLSTNIADKDASNTMYSGNYEQVVKAISEYSADGKIWNTFYEDAILYLQEAQNAKVDVRVSSEGTIYLNLTDGISRFMLDENGNETDEQIYNYPLTVRVNVPSDWEAVKVVQDGKVSYVKTKLVDGTLVADTDIVPDGGEAKVTRANLSDIPEPEKPAGVVGSGENLEYDAFYGFENGTVDVVTSIPASSESTTTVKTVGNNSWLNITKGQPAGNPSWTLYGGYLPAVSSAMTVSFKIRIDEAMLLPGSYNNITGNKRIMNISFADNSPYTLIIYRDLANSTDGTSGTLYLTDCNDPKNFSVDLSKNMICALELGEEYEIKVEMLMDGVNDFAAVVYVNGEKVKESSNTTGYEKGKIPTVEYVKFLALGRAVIDMLIDDVSIETTAPSGKADVTVYEQNFDSKNVTMSTGGNNTVKATYGSPDGNGIALNINKTTADNTTHSWNMIGSAVTNATGFRFKFDVYIDSASVVGSSTRLYQIHFGSSTPYILTIELSSDKSGFVLVDMANTSATLNPTRTTDTISFDEWHTIELVVSLDEFAAVAYVDGKTNGTVSYNYARSSDGDPVKTSVDRIILYAQKASGANVYFDNFKLTAEVNFG